MHIIVDTIAVRWKKDDGPKNGKTVLFLHGWGDSLETFDNLVSRLTSRYHCVRLDLPGFGRTETPHEAWGVARYARFVAEFLVKIGIKPDTIVGHSFGGRILLKGVSMNIFNPKDLILIGSAGVAKRRTTKLIILNGIAKILKFVLLPLPFSFREKIRRKAYCTLRSDYTETGTLREIFSNIISEDLSDDARNINLPTLLIWGSDDTATPIEEGECLASLITHSELKILSNAGHFVHQEYPDEVGEHIKKFLKA